MDDFHLTMVFFFLLTNAIALTARPPLPRKGRRPSDWYEQLRVWLDSKPTMFSGVLVGMWVSMPLLLAWWAAETIWS